MKKRVTSVLLAIVMLACTALSGFAAEETGKEVARPGDVIERPDDRFDTGKTKPVTELESAEADDELNPRELLQQLEEQEAQTDRFIVKYKEEAPNQAKFFAQQQSVDVLQPGLAKEAKAIAPEDGELLPDADLDDDTTDDELFQPEDDGDTEPSLPDDDTDPPDEGDDISSETPSDEPGDGDIIPTIPTLETEQVMAGLVAGRSNMPVAFLSTHVGNATALEPIDNGTDCCYNNESKGVRISHNPPHHPNVKRRLK